MTKTAFFQLALKVIGIPALSAFGVWLAVQYPAYHTAICSPVGL